MSKLASIIDIYIPTSQYVHTEKFARKYSSIFLNLFWKTTVERTTMKELVFITAILCFWVTYGKSKALH